MVWKPRDVLVQVRGREAERIRLKAEKPLKGIAETARRKGFKKGCGVAIPAEIREERVV
jgi:hypothetical protein